MLSLRTRMAKTSFVFSPTYSVEISGSIISGSVYNDVPPDVPFTVLSDSNRVLLLLAYGTGSTNIYWNGTPLTKYNAYSSIDVWYLVNPEAGLYNISFTQTSGFYSHGIFCLKNCKQTTPLSGWGTGTQSGTSGSVVTASTGGGMAIGIAADGDTAVGIGGQTLLFNDWRIHADYLPGTGANVSFGFTYNTTGTGPLVAFCVDKV